MERNRRSNIPLLKRLFPRGTVIGLIFFTVLFALSLAWNAGFSVMGVQQADAIKLVKTSFWPFLVLAQVKILLVYLCLGYALGGIAEWITRSLPVRFPGERFLFIFLANGYLLLKNIRAYPQLYTESLYDRGGILRQFQLAITDQLPDRAFLILGIFLFLVIALSFVFWAVKKIASKSYLPVIVFVICALILPVRILKTVSVNHLHHRAASGNNGPNIVILAADSFRRGPLSNGKYPDDIAPVINRLIDQGVVFNKEYTSLPRTFPAMISFLTGKLPVTHGVRHMFPTRYERDHEQGSLPQILRENGYTTAVVSDFAGDVFSRMKIGFDIVRVPYFNFLTLIDQRSLEIHPLLFPYITNRYGRALFPELKEFASNADPFLLADETIDTIDRVSGNKFFCLTFFSTLHFPYAAPYPFYRQFTLKDYQGRYKYHKPPAVYENEALAPEDIEQVRGLYNGAVASFDRAAGRVLAHLEAKGLLDNTIVIVMADHGENLYENNWHVGHGEHLIGQNVINVPLIISFPGQGIAPRAVGCLTRDVDVAPTLLDYLHLPMPPVIDGISLMPLIRGEKDDLGLTAFSETGIWFSDVTDAFYQKQRIWYPDITGISKIDFAYNMEVVIKDEYRDLVTLAKHRMIDDGAFRLVYIPTREGVKYELYDTRNDPAFSTNAVVQYPKEFWRLRALLQQYMSKDPAIVWRKEFAVPGRAD